MMQASVFKAGDKVVRVRECTPFAEESGMYTGRVYTVGFVSPVHRRLQLTEARGWWSPDHFQVCTPAQTPDAYQGHQDNGSGLQKHSIGDIYPVVVYGFGDGTFAWVDHEKKMMGNRWDTSDNAHRAARGYRGRSRTIPTVEGAGAAHKNYQDEFCRARDVQHLTAPSVDEDKELALERARKLLQHATDLEHINALYHFIKENR